MINRRMAKSKLREVMSIIDINKVQQAIKDNRVLCFDKHKKYVVFTIEFQYPAWWEQIKVSYPTGLKLIDDYCKNKCIVTL